MAKLLPVVAVALVDAEGCVLLAQRPPGKDHAGLWEFPGGKFKESETPEQALVRELREELGIETETSCLAPLAFSSEVLKKDENLEEVHLLLLLFICRKWQGIPQGLEGQRIKWARPQDLMGFDMPKADKSLAAQVRYLLCSKS